MNLNSGDEWSEMDDRDLAQAITFAENVAEIADFLCREVNEVRERAVELGPERLANFVGRDAGEMRKRAHDLGLRIETGTSH